MPLPRPDLHGAGRLLDLMIRRGRLGRDKRVALIRWWYSAYTRGCRKESEQHQNRRREMEQLLAAQQRVQQLLDAQQLRWERWELLQLLLPPLPMHEQLLDRSDQQQLEQELLQLQRQHRLLQEMRALPSPMAAQWLQQFERTLHEFGQRLDRQQLIRELRLERWSKQQLWQCFQCVL